MRPHLVSKEVSAAAIQVKFLVSQAAAEIAFDEYVTKRKPKQLPIGLVEALKMELAETTRRESQIALRPQRGPAVDEKERLWSEAPEAPGYDPTKFRLASSKWLIAKSEFRRMTHCGWTIANGSIVAYFPSQIA